MFTLSLWRVCILIAVTGSMLAPHLCVWQINEYDVIAAWGDVTAWEQIFRLKAPKNKQPYMFSPVLKMCDCYGIIYYTNYFISE